MIVARSRVDKATANDPAGRLSQVMKYGVSSLF